jgi:hypothetical protein
MDLKEKYSKVLEDRLGELKVRIERLQAKTSQMKADAKEEWDRRIWELSEKQKNARWKLQELKETGAEKVEALKTMAEKVWDDLESAVGRIKSKFKK